jgi:pimeloyl-ACP methyl ester carboxylesterase
MTGPRREAVAAAMRRLLTAGGSAAASRVTRVAGADLHYLEEGSGSTVVVLLHGGSGGGANWFRLLPRLARRYRVLAPDLPGFGLSGRRPLRPPLGAQAAALLDEWLHAVGAVRALVVGTSFGGLAAARLALRSPQRISHLMLLDAAGLGRRIHPLVRLAALRFLVRPAVRPTRRGTAALFRTLLTRYRDELSAEQTDALIAYLHESAAAAGTDYLAETLRLFIGPRGQREVLSTAELAALPMPVAIVWGEDDTFLPPADARAAAAACPNATFTAVPRAGHSPNWERADAVLQAVDVLAGR